MESTRAKEAEVRKETRGQLEVFRRQQEEAEKAAQLQPAEEVAEGETVSWTTTGARKRKKGREGGIGGVKLRRTSTNERHGVASPAISKCPDNEATAEAGGAEAVPPGQVAARTADDAGKVSREAAVTSPPAMNSPATKSVSPAAGVGLVAYSSDEDDD